MPNYSDKLKGSIVQKMMPPQNQSVIELEKETGIAKSTLYQWRRNARAAGKVYSDGKPSKEKWSSRDKFNLVVESMSMSEAELAEYCRSKGLFVEQVEAWKDACMQANGGVAQESNRLQKEVRNKDIENRNLQKELRRKESALAEAAALLVLRKKAEAIWVDNEDA
jgi:transposase